MLHRTDRYRGTDAPTDRNARVFTVNWSKESGGLKDPEDEGTKILRNVGTSLPVGTA